MSRGIDTIVLGGSGYVAGELLRLISAHPDLELKAAISGSQADQTLESVFPQLHASFEGHRFQPIDSIVRLSEEARRPVAVFSAAAHGASAALVSDVLQATKGDDGIHVVDMSADFRYTSAEAYEAVYGQPHGAPDLLPRFTCALPEHLPEDRPGHVGHPGCFATALLLAIVPLLKLGMVEPDLYAVGITGSTGSGGSPKSTTHHPFRHSNLFSYKPLAHRHVPEVTALAERASGIRPAVHFVPHSGPFARGIHVTVQGTLRTELTSADIAAEIDAFYAEAPFVRVVEGEPRMKDIVGSNYAQLGVASDGKTFAVMTVIDNLTKGAAGGAVQWMNRLLGLPETTGLTLTGAGWV